MKKHLINLLILGAVLALSLQSATGIETNLATEVLMKKEYQVMAKLRHKLKELLERQELEEILQEGDDAYNSFQNLEQWLQQLESNPSDKAMQELFEALKEFESHLSQVLKQQEELAEQLPADLSAAQNKERIPLSQLMQTLRDLLKNGKFEEARQMLNQMLSAYNQQQQQLQQSVAQYNSGKFAETSQQLNQLLEQVTHALHQEKQVSALLRQYLEASRLPPNVQTQANVPQNQVTQLTEEMQMSLEQMPASPLLSMEQLMPLIQNSQTASQTTTTQINSNQPQLAFQAAQDTQSNLEEIRRQVTGLQQQIQQLSQSQGRSRRNGRMNQGFWSEKGVRPPKFEYDFQVNPAYRDEIQELNQKKHPQITPRQQQYLQDVIK